MLIYFNITKKCLYLFSFTVPTFSQIHYIINNLLEDLVIIVPVQSGRAWEKKIRLWRKCVLPDLIHLYIIIPFFLSCLCPWLFSGIVSYSLYNWFLFLPFLFIICSNCVPPFAPTGSFSSFFPFPVHFAIICLLSSCCPPTWLC